MRAGLPKGTISASLAETMLLTFEEKIASYFLTDSLNADRLEEIADIAVRHGFEVWAPQAPIL
jgi:predicted amino acid dehydrogenase